ncbi:hypothetical protein DR64_537 [Paraburkholderia xenovorans LB400]|jgi:hypothetical protein|uniref:hypothetical protein n=1 Tax=Paraburkholderia xenovorans TaxID=36873 RepID=UPI0004F7EE61|nr:hypothetical protein [Paraburkholderia xenovorans]AIP33011.1 hypothetical protein DR64_537 [Paraburkholderia xenovorans LB400]
MTSNQWPFSELPNVAVIANRKIVQGREWIAYVSHDSDDGAWQFHTSAQEPPTEGEAALVSLESIMKIDGTIAELADLPLGWHAWRKSKSEPWQRAKM